MDIGTGTGANVLASLFPCAIRKAKMVFFLHQSVRHMEVDVRRLKDLRDAINAELTQEQRNPKPMVKTWLEKVDSVIERSECIRKEYEHCCSNLFCRYRINKHISVWLKDVVKIHQEKLDNHPQSVRFGEIAPPIYIPTQIPESGFVGNVIQSAQSKIEGWLMDESSHVKIIGLYGMGGVGKTSLVQAINNNSQIRKSFDLIIWVTVSKDYDVLDLQSCIADRLRLNHFPDKSNSLGREAMLYSYLSKKKYILILDDMWEKLNLSRLGVSLDEKSYKVLITTRSKTVCSSMDAEEMIQLDPLSEEEGWKLFCRRAFHRNNEVPPYIEDVARKVARECNGLPLAIIVIAAAMKRYDYRHQWELALVQMLNNDETFYDMNDETDKSLLQRLKWSYDDLPSCLKSCFVYFAAYPEDKRICCEEVTKMWITEGVVKGGRESHLPDIAQSFINDLSDRCLIEVTERDIFGRIWNVKIHDVLRDLTILIARKEHQCFFKAGQRVKDFPCVEENGGWLRMSLFYGSLRSLPITFACPSILVLTLRRCHNITRVPGDFLLGMPLLRVLDLSRTSITSLPLCIGELHHLSSLQLEGTMIRELPETIGYLSKLQFLNIAFCRDLYYLPTSMADLKCLVALDIRYCQNLNIIPRVISKLVSLQRLSMHNSIALEFDAPNNTMDERSCLCLQDLQSLCNLWEFSVRVKSPVWEGVLANWPNMRYLWMDFNDTNQIFLPEDMKTMKDELEGLSLWFCNMEKLPSWIIEFRKISSLCLSFFKHLKELPTELYELPSLRELTLNECGMLKELDLGKGGFCFPKLEELILSDLNSLESVVAERCWSNGGVLGECALPMLKSFQVRRCEKLRMLPLGWDKLRYLEEIRGDKDWWDSIEWQDNLMKTSLQAKFSSQ